MSTWFSDPSFTMGAELSEEVENHKDLIFALVHCPQFFPVKYKSGGIYDRVMQNFKDHKGEESLFENNKYQWVRIPAPSHIHSVKLVRPGKVPRQIRMGNYNTWENIARLDEFFYYSAAYDNIQGFTFGDRKHIIKPLKILNHSWILHHAELNQAFWKCSECGLTGRSQTENAKVIIPTSFLTCEEFMIKDIIL